MSDNRYSLPDDPASRRTMQSELAMTPAPDDGDLGISNDDIRIVAVYLYQLSLDASDDPSLPMYEDDPSSPTPEEKAEVEKLAASFERLKKMTREEMLAERSRRLRRPHRLEGDR
jgi:hypothetical protein